MASRLSEQSLAKAYDKGHKSHYVRGLPFEGAPLSSPLKSASENLLGQGLDLDALSLKDSEELEEAVQAISAQDLYHAIMLKGPEDSLAILPHLSQEQLVKFLDYDVWQQDELSPQKMARWIEVFGELGPEELCRRYRSLDEEYQTAFFAPYLRLVDLEEYEKLSDAEQDRFHALPCGELFYSLSTEEPALLQAFDLLIQSMLGQDINYLYSLLNHSFHLPPGEQEMILKQMRQARLEEDGFVTFEESYQYFVPLSVLEQKRELPKRIEPLVLPWREVDPCSAKTGQGELPEEKRASAKGAFLEAVFSALTTQPSQGEQVKKQFLILANALCSATQVEPDDLKGAELLLGHGQAVVSLALEWVTDRDPAQAAAFLLAKGPKLVFRIGVSLVHQYGVMVLEAFQALGFDGADKILRYYLGRKFGLALSGVETQWLETLGLERTQWLMGLLNRFPLRLVEAQSAHGVAEALGQHDAQEELRQGASAEEHLPTTGSSLIFEPIDSVWRLSLLAADAEAFIDHLRHAVHVDPLSQGEKPVGSRQISLDV